MDCARKPSPNECKSGKTEDTGHGICASNWSLLLSRSGYFGLAVKLERLSRDPGLSIETRILSAPKTTYCSSPGFSTTCDCLIRPWTDPAERQRTYEGPSEVHGVARD